MDFVLYITFVYKPAVHGGGWKSLFAPNKQALHLTYSDVYRASVLIMVARVSPISFGENKVGHGFITTTSSTNTTAVQYYHSSNHPVVQSPNVPT